MAKKWVFRDGWWGWSEGSAPEPASTDYAAQQARAAVADAMPRKRSLRDCIAALTEARKQQADPRTDEEMAVSTGGRPPRPGRGHFDTAEDTDVKLAGYQYKPAPQRGTSLFAKSTQGKMEVDPETGEKKWIPTGEADLAEARRQFNYTMFHDK